MTAASTRLPGLPDDVYAPEFQIELEGVKLDPRSKGDVLELKVEMKLNELASAEIKLNNYDDRTFDLRWSERGEFEIGNRVHVQMGYADRLVSMLRGRTVSLSPDFPSDGTPTLTVRAYDGLVRLKESKAPPDESTYRNLADWQIAQRIAKRHGLRYDVKQEGPKHPLVVQRDTDDATFLMERAARIDFELFIRVDPKTGEDVLCFLPAADGRAATPARTYQLAWGALRGTHEQPSLIEFKPTLTASEQVQSVTVRGWDPTQKAEIVHKADAGNTPGVSGHGKATGPAAAARIGGAAARQDVVVDAPVATLEEARHLAEALLTARAYEFLTGKCRTVGLPDLRPGDNAEISGVGERFGGTYFVTAATHTLDARGLLTEFDVRKTYEGSRP
jgi:Bacteriophage probable baseplate hub protein